MMGDCFALVRLSAMYWCISIIWRVNAATVGIGRYGNRGGDGYIVKLCDSMTVPRYRPKSIRIDNLGSGRKESQTLSIITKTGNLFQILWSRKKITSKYLLTFFCMLWYDTSVNAECKTTGHLIVGTWHRHIISTCWISNYSATYRASERARNVK